MGARVQTKQPRQIVCWRYVPEFELSTEVQKSALVRKRQAGRHQAVPSWCIQSVTSYSRQGCGLRPYLDWPSQPIHRLVARHSQPTFPSEVVALTEATAKSERASYGCMPIQQARSKGKFQYELSIATSVNDPHLTVGSRTSSSLGMDPEIRYTTFLVSPGQSDSLRVLPTVSPKRSSHRIILGLS